jgi:hypothetical protein
MKASEIEMRIDYIKDLIELKIRNETFASTRLSILEAQELRAFIKIGQQGIKYSIFVSS